MVDLAESVAAAEAEKLTPSLTIDEISRDTGLGKDTLRVWERRYGFPDPRRAEGGERLYNEAQLQRLRLICRLVDLGCRPGRVVPLPVEALKRLAEERSATAAKTTNPAIESLMALLQAGKTEAFKDRLLQLLEQQGPKNFVYQTVEPLLQLTGDAWAAGQIPIYLEHFVTQQLTAVIQVALTRVTVVPSGLRLLLSTLPGEPHAMGLIMVELLLRLQGVETVNLGTENPVDQLQQACRALQPDGVALSFSAVQKRPQLMPMLTELEERIPQSVAILAGGAGITRLRSLPKRIEVIKQTSRLEAAVKVLHRRLHRQHRSDA